MPTAPLTVPTTLDDRVTPATLELYEIVVELPRRSPLGCLLLWTDSRWLAAHPAVWDGDQA